MPFSIEKDGKTITVWSQEEVDAEVAGLKVTNENLKAEKKDVQEKLNESKEAIRSAEEAKAKAEGDNETLRRIGEEREAEKRQAVDDERKKFSDLLNITKKEKVDNFLTSIIDSVKPADATSAKHLRKLIKADYDIDYDLESGEFKVSGSGAASVDELKKVLVDSGEYDRYLAGSGNTGGGATGGSASGAGKKWQDMSEKERLQLKQDNPVLFYKHLRG